MPPYPEKYVTKDKENAVVSRLSGESFPMPKNAKGKLGEIVMKACSYNMRDRFPSAALMRKELEKINYAKAEKAVIKIDPNQPVPSEPPKSEDDDEPNEPHELEEKDNPPKKAFPKKIAVIIASFFAVALLAAAIWIFADRNKIADNDSYNVGVEPEEIEDTPEPTPSTEPTTPKPTQDIFHSQCGLVAQHGDKERWQPLGLVQRTN